MSRGSILILLLFLFTLPVKSQLLINELQASNIKTKTDPGSNYSQWIEIYNGGDHGLDLYGYFLSDEPGEPRKYKVSEHHYVSSGKRVLLWLDPTNKYFLPLKLDMDGGELTLANSSGEVLDHISYPQQYLDISYGRRTNGSSSLGFFKDPTPGNSNKTDCILDGKRSDPVQFSLPGGLYSGSRELLLSCTSPAAEIRFTKDGSWPTESSYLYRSPISITSSTVIRARVFEDELLPGDVSTNTYFLDEESSIPIVSISTDPDHLFSSDLGMYVEGSHGKTGLCSEVPVNWNMDWERPVNIEYFEKDGSRVINQMAGTSIFGGCSRSFSFKSMALYARKRYGDNSFSHPFFASKDIDEFKGLVLRNSGNDSYYSLLRDGFMQSLVMDELDIDYLAYQPASIFINGAYWGILNVREKINEHYVAANYSIDPDQVDMLEKEQYFNWGEVISGSGEYYEELFEYLEQNELSDDAHFDHVSTLMDVDEFLNYYLLQIYFQNEDWPQNNIKYWRYHGEGGKWRWILFDTDTGWGMNPHTGNALEWATRGASTDRLIRYLLDNEGFKDEFIQRMAGLINTLFLPERVHPILDSLIALIDDEIPRHAERWGNPSVSRFEYQTGVLMPHFTETRRDSMRIFVQQKFGITGLVRLSAEVDDPRRGHIEAAGLKLPDQFSGLYFRGVPLRVRAVPAPGYVFSHWEASSNSSAGTIVMDLNGDEGVRAVFKASEPLENIYINEVAASNASVVVDEFSQSDDWIEIYNDNDFELDLAGCFLSDTYEDLGMYQIPYGSPELTRIGAKDFLLIWCDAESEQGPLHTNFKLSKNGESLYLGQKQSGQVGMIDSLAFTKQYTDLSFGLNPIEDRWDYLIPTPGAANQLHNPGVLFINEYMTRNDGSLLDDFGESDDWIELYNPTDDTIDIGGLFLTDSLGNPLQYQLPSGEVATLIPPAGYKLLWADGQEEQGVLHLGFKLDSRSEQIGIYQVGAGFLDSLSYYGKDPDIPFGRLPDGSANIQYVYQSPGAGNRVVAREGLFINEFMAKNYGSYPDEFGESDDWIEIYNGNDYPVDVGGIFLTDSLGDPMKYQIPVGVPDSTTIAARGYLLLWADGQEEQGVRHLGFKLDSRSEQIGICQSGSGFMDSLSYLFTHDDISLGRLPDGEAQMHYLSATPGERNNVIKLEGILINEFMAKNLSTLNDEYGEYDDWIELYNENPFPVDLGGFFMTDSLGLPTKYRFPTGVPDSTTIPAQGYLMIWADNQKEQGAVHLNFSLSAKGEEIGLVQPDGIHFIDNLSYTSLLADQALGLLDEDAGGYSLVTASPGLPNYITPSEKLSISEIQASGNEMFADQHGEYDDWVEIYNDNDYAVDIGGFYLSDSLQHLQKFRMPSYAPDSTTIEAGGYLILWADNQPDQGVTHLNFKLSGEGEFLALIAADGQEIIDSLSFPNQYKHFSYSREDNTRQWKHFPPTMSEPNDAPPPGGLVINEFMTSNTSIPDEHGEFDDWIEINNTNSFALDVGGLYLTDSTGSPTKYRIPSHTPSATTINPGSYLLIFADNQRDQGVNHTNFKLKREGEQIALIHYDERTIIDSLSYGKQFRNASSSLIQKEGRWFSLPPTPGTENVAPDLSFLVINEIMGYNRTVIGDDHGEYENWIELYNRGSSSIDIGGLYFTDSLADPCKFRVSTEYPDSTTIAPFDFLTLWADNTADQGILHLGFGIDRTGEEVGVFDYGGKVVDSIYYPFISPNISWGRMPDGYEAWTQFPHPTPSQSNAITHLSAREADHLQPKIFPNPVREKATFEIPVEKAGKIWIQIVDAHGSSVSIIQAYATQAGRELISWEAKDDGDGPLAPGLYMFQLVSGKKSYSGKFILQ